MTYAIVRSVGTPYFDADTYITTAADIDGKWTAPQRVASHGFDPALFHDEGRLWLLNLQNDCRPGGRRFAGIVATELDRDTLTPTGTTHLLLQHERLVEGPKLVRRGGWYYLLLAEGGTGFEHGVLVARSRTVTGPYELDDRPLLTSRDDPSVPLQKAGHGELVELPGGDWVLSHLAARPVQTPDGPRCTLGRETAIQAVTWDADDWPRLRQGGRKIRRSRWTWRRVPPRSTKSRTPTARWAGPGAARALTRTPPGPTLPPAPAGSGCAGGTGRSHAGRTVCSPSGSRSTSRRPKSRSTQAR